MITKAVALGLISLSMLSYAAVENLMNENDMPMPGPMPMPDMPMMMYMSFWSGTDLTWVYYRIKSSDTGTYVLGLIITYLLSILLEGLTYLRNFVYMRSQLTAIRNTEALNR